MPGPERTRYQPYGTGVYRREVRARVGADWAEGELIDDFHHFRATLRHDGERVTQAGGDAPRHPWSTCREAGGALRSLVGAPLTPSLRGPGRFTDPRLQCTHWFDAACLAIASAARGRRAVVYRIEVPDRVDGRTRAAIARDGKPVLWWQLEGAQIVAPAEYSGRSVTGGLADWAEAELDLDAAEAVLLLQRACVISGGRAMDLESVPKANALEPRPMGACYTYQPGNVERGVRQVGTIRNLTAVEDVRRASLAPAPPEDRVPARARDGV